MKNRLLLVGLLLAWLISACNTVPPTPDPAQSPIADATRTAADGQPILQIDSGGHMAIIKNIFFTHDGKMLISASNDKTVRVWDITSGKTIRILRGQIGPGVEGKIYAAALSPDDRWLALGGWFIREDNSYIRLIDLLSGQVVRLLKGHRNVIQSLAFSADSRRLVSGSADTTARIWDVASGASLHTLNGHRNAIYAVAFSPDGRLTVTGSDDHSLKLWDSATGKQLADLHGHTDKVRSVAFTPDGRYLLSGSWDQTIRLWNSQTGAANKVLARQDATVDHLSIAPDGSKVLTGAGYGQKINNVFAIPSGERLASFSGHQNVVVATAISPDGKTAATGDGDSHEIYLWDIHTGTIQQHLIGRGELIWSIGFADDGRSITWGKTWSQESLLRKGEVEHSFQLKDAVGNFSLALGKLIGSTAQSDSRFLHAIGTAGAISVGTASGQRDATLQIKKNGRVLHTVTRDGTNGYFHQSITLTPDGRTVVSGSGNGNITAYDTASGRKLRDFIGHTGDVWAVAPSPDGRLLVSGSGDQTVRLWEIASGKLLLTIFHGNDGEWVAWTEDGFYTASAKGDAYVGYHINRGDGQAADYVGLDQIGRHFYRPDLVAKTVQGGHEREIAAELARIGSIDQLIANGLPPEVRVLNASGETSNERNFTLEVALKPMSGGIGTIRYFVNGAEIASATARSGEAPPGMRRSGVIKDDERYAAKPLTLPDGANEITVVACNQNDTICSREIKLTRSVHDPRNRQPSLHILAVGIANYRDRDLHLKFAGNDAKALSTRLQQQAQGLYRVVHTPVVLLDKDATAEKIEQAFDGIAKRIEPNDVFVLFMAGHGMAWQGDYHFIPWEALYENTETLVKASLSQEKLAALLKRIPTSKSLIILDSCSAGQLAADFAEGKQFAMLTRGGIGDKSAIDRLMRATGRYVLAATTEKQQALEGHDQHGVFTWALLEGLKGHASRPGSNDGSISLDELADYVREQVPKITQQKWGFEQIPMRLIQGDSFPITCKAGYEKPGCKP
ncbi:WD40 repeat protein [Nitrosomonas oligotropha]|uniref:WD40 repeat protein n=1 Tax=Nitrosomonas oligotropha TaxID=42354 RepID=A0A2T5I3Y8_9PROT|nr:caspase family protein [Nitrosomonas oligotropha]PTQ78557.1 WD40 repeat protein [Nitrosomonas oligotropha]